MIHSKNSRQRVKEIEFQQQICWADYIFLICQIWSIFEELENCININIFNVLNYNNIPLCYCSHTSLHLSKTQRLVLKASHIQHSLSHSLTGITHATSHHQVKLSLWHLSLWLTTGLLMDSDDVQFPSSPCGQFLLLEWRDVLKRCVWICNGCKTHSESGYVEGAFASCFLLLKLQTSTAFLKESVSQAIWRTTLKLVCTHLMLSLLFCFVVCCVFYLLI